MKKLAFITIILLSAFAADAQICDITQRGQNIEVFNCTGSRISSRYLIGDEKLIDYSESLIVVKGMGDNIIVYDTKFSQISSKFLFDGDIVKNVIGNYIMIRDNRGLVTIYDKNFNRVGSHFE